MSFTGKWLPDSLAYRAECLKIAKDLTGFKQNPIYRRYINNDNRPRETAQAFYDYIRLHYPEILAFINYFKINDRIGSPTLYDIAGHQISPGTLRYMKVMGDILSRCAPYSVVEIGGGYGGQCAIFNAVKPEGVYTIVDIPEALAVTKAYLDVLDIKAQFVHTISEPLAADLVISDYCISEMNWAGIDYYLHRVIRHCRNGYFTCNKIGHTDYLLSRLEEIFTTVAIADEIPRTSKHKNIIVYAMDNRYL